MSRDIRAIVVQAQHTISRTRDQLTMVVVISNPPTDLLPTRGEAVTITFPEPETT